LIPARSPGKPEEEDGCDNGDGYRLQGDVAAEDDPGAEAHEQVQYRSVDGCHVRLWS
jgi:hypothetical protein